VNYQELLSMSTNAETLASELIIAAVRLVRTVRANDAEARLPSPLASALAAVVHSGGITLGELAAIECVGRPAITKVARALEAGGYAARAQDPHDGRVWRLTATPSGQALIGEGQARHDKALAKKIEAMGADEAAVLRDAVGLIARLTAV